MEAGSRRAKMEGGGGRTDTNHRKGSTMPGMDGTQISPDAWSPVELERTQLRYQMLPVLDATRRRAAPKAT